MNKFFGENFQKLKNINRLRNLGGRNSIRKCKLIFKNKFRIFQ